MAAEKKFAPSARRLKKAREDGDVAKSRELTAAASILGALSYLGLAGWGGQNILLFSDEIIRVTADFEFGNMVGLSAAALRVFFVVVLPILGSAFICALIAEIYQVGWLVRFNLVAPRFSRLNFSKGFCRLFGIATDGSPSSGTWFVELAKLTVYVIAGGSISALVSLAACRELLGGAIWQPGVMLELAKASLIGAALPVVAVLLLLGIADYLIQLRRRTSRLRMDANEFKQELRENEGDAEQRGLRKQLHLELAAQNIVHKVRNSKVVVLGRDR